MGLELYVSLPLILFLGVVTSYEDFREGKIRNKWILAAVVYALVSFSGLLVYFYYHGGFRITYAVEYFVMGIISLVIGYVIWLVGLWKAGDAKLFFAYSLLVPLSTYKHGYLPYFSSTNILINTFTPMFLFLSIVVLFRTSIRQKLYYLKKTFMLRNLASLFVFLFAFIWIMNLGFGLVGIYPDYFMSILFLFILVILIEKVLPFKLFTVVVIMAVLRLLFDHSVYTLDSWKFLLWVFVMFLFLRYFILYLGFSLLTKDVDIKLLKPGMVPAEKVYLEGGSYKKESILYFSLFSYLYEKAQKKEYLIEADAEGLTAEDVDKLQKMESKLGFEHLRIHQTFSFAPFMFFGVLLTLFFEGNAFIALAPYFWSLF